MLTIKEAFLTENPYYKQARPITPTKLVLHSVGCAQPNASVFLKNWNKETYKRACIHAFIDANNGTVYQTMPWEWRAPHAGGVWLNDNSIGVEMCESSHIKYIGQTDRFNIINREAALAHAKTTYMAAVELFAYLCLRFNLDPFEDILSHKEGGIQNIASDHSDPEHYWDQLGTGYTMKGFRQDVANAMEGNPTVTIVEKKEEEKTMASTYNFPTLRKGNKGPYVKALQKMLEASGYSCGKAGIDGDFGNGTETALMDFQDDHGLVPDGVAGAATWPVVIAAPNIAGDKALREKYNTLQASADALRTRILNAVETFDKGKA